MGAARMTIGAVRRVWSYVFRRRRGQMPEQWIKMTTKRWAELLDLQRRQDEQR
jgi:hypothetical protein